MRQAVVETARSYLDCPWRHLGRTRAGLDCVGLIVLVGRECGVHDYPDDINYTRASRGTDLLEPLRKFSTRIGAINLADGDIAVFRENVFPQHMGIVGSWDGGVRTLIHSTAHERKVVEVEWGKAQDETLLAAFRFNFLAQE